MAHLKQEVALLHMAVVEALGLEEAVQMDLQLVGVELLEEAEPPKESQGNDTNNCMAAVQGMTSADYAKLIAGED